MVFPANPPPPPLRKNPTASQTGPQAESPGSVQRPFNTRLWMVPFCLQRCFASRCSFCVLGSCFYQQDLPTTLHFSRVLPHQAAKSGHAGPAAPTLPDGEPPGSTPCPCTAALSRLLLEPRQLASICGGGRGLQTGVSWSGGTQRLWVSQKCRQRQKQAAGDQAGLGAHGVLLFDGTELRQEDEHSSQMGWR